MPAFRTCLPIVLALVGCRAGFELLEPDAGMQQPGDDARPPDGDHVIFVTSQRVTGAFGSLAQADQICRQAAAAGSLPGNFRALVSTETESALQRLAIAGAVTNTRGEVVASSAVAFWSGSHTAAVAYDELGRANASNVWTGTVVSGAVHQLNCICWTDQSGTRSRIGSPSATNAAWVELTDTTCDSTLAFYCVSD